MAIAASDHHMPAPGDASPGATLFLRRKRPTAGSEATPVLLLHGSTLPGSLAFDLPLGGTSWLDDLAGAGLDAWSLDLRGYGRSWKPAVRHRDDGTEQPLVRTEEAVQDLMAAIDFVRDRTGAAEIDLVGWSWGCTIVGAALSRGAAGVRRAVLHAPQWLRSTPSAMVTPAALTTSYRRVDPVGMQERWFLGLAAGPRAVVGSRGWDAAFRDALLTQGEVMQVPNGTIQDIAEYWMAGRPFYDPGRIGVPVRIIVGDADKDTPPSQAEAILSRLPRGRADLVRLPEATHFALLEPARDALFAAAREFLTRP